jgi:hypothetical protein
MNTQFGNFAFNWLPVTQATSFRLPQAGGNSNLCLLVFKIVKPVDKLFRLANGKYGRLYSIGYKQSTG